MLEYSALLFIIPAVYAWYKNNIDYGNAFIFLTITSYIYHKNNKYNYLINWRFWIDQFAIFNVVLIGTYYYFYQFNNMMILFKILIPLFCISCLILYIYKSIIKPYIYLITF